MGSINEMGLVRGGLLLVPLEVSVEVVPIEVVPIEIVPIEVVPIEVPIESRRARSEQGSIGQARAGIDSALSSKQVQVPPVEHIMHSDLLVHLDIGHGESNLPLVRRRWRSTICIICLNSRGHLEGGLDLVHRGRPGCSDC